MAAATALRARLKRRGDGARVGAAERRPRGRAAPGAARRASARRRASRPRGARRTPRASLRRRSPPSCRTAGSGRTSPGSGRTARARRVSTGGTIGVAKIWEWGWASEAPAARPWFRMTVTAAAPPAQQRGDASLVHGHDVGHLGERLGVQRQVVARRVHDDLVTALEDRELVGHDAHGPAGRVGGAAGRAQGVELGRRQAARGPRRRDSRRAAASAGRRVGRRASCGRSRAGRRRGRVGRRSRRGARRREGRAPRRGAITVQAPLSGSRRRPPEESLTAARAGRRRAWGRRGVVTA